MSSGITMQEMQTSSSIQSTSSAEVQKWCENVERELAPGCTPTLVWEFLGSFSGLNRWLLSIQDCHLLEGQDGVPGAVRFCSGRPPRCSPSSPPICVTEKLLSYNLSQRSFSYSILDSTYGFRNYISRFSVLSSPSSVAPSSPSQQPHHTSDRTLIQWSFELSPVPGRSRREVIDFLLAIFDRMISNLETAVLTSAAAAATAPSPDPSTSNNTTVSTSVCVKG